jgi:hypothetical protein
VLGVVLDLLVRTRDLLHGHALAWRGE